MKLTGRWRRWILTCCQKKYSLKFQFFISWTFITLSRWLHRCARWLTTLSVGKKPSKESREWMQPTKNLKIKEAHKRVSSFIKLFFFGWCNASRSRIYLPTEESEKHNKLWIKLKLKYKNVGLFSLSFRDLSATLHLRPVSVSIENPVLAKVFLLPFLHFHANVLLSHQGRRGSVH